LPVFPATEKQALLRLKRKNKMQIDYQSLIQSAFLSVVKQALITLQKKGPGSHAFYLEFQTNAPGVEMPVHLSEQFPTDMRIVLEHQFKNLEVGEDSLKVDLAFSGIFYSFVIPFKSLISFVDAEAQFALQFLPQKPKSHPEKPAQVISLDEMRNKK